MSNGNIPTKSSKQQAAAVESSRMYQQVWEAIKAAPTGQVTNVATHPDNVRRLIQAVKKEKTAEVGLRKKLELLRPGPLKIDTSKEKDPATGQPTGRIIISFSLSFDGSKL